MCSMCTFPNFTDSALCNQCQRDSRKSMYVLHPSNWYFFLLQYSTRVIATCIVVVYTVIALLCALVTWPMWEDIYVESSDNNEGWLDVDEAGKGFAVATCFAFSNIVTMGFGPCMPSTYATFVLAITQQFICVSLSALLHRGHLVPEAQF